MRLNSSKIEDALHEFAHTLAGTDSDKVGITNDKAFWDEVRKIRTQYRKAVREDHKKTISSYADSGNKLDEFMAEAFMQAKAAQMNIKLPDQYGNDLTYANIVLSIIDKYFKK